MARTQRLWASDRFIQSVERGGAWLYEDAWKKVNYALEVCASDPAGVQRFERVEHLRPRHDVLEIDLHGAFRLLADFSRGRLTLLDFGGKDVVPGYSAAAYRRDMESARPIKPYAPPTASEGTPAGTGDFFGSGVGPTLGSFDGVEDTTAWLYFLDEHQGAVADQILEDVIQGKAGESKRFFLIGPPGTGKTAILLNLLVRARQRRLKAGIWLSDSLARYCELWGLSLEGRRWSPGDRKKSWDLLLVDDPVDVGAIDLSMLESLAKSKVTVAAFDPLQLRGEITDAAFIGTVHRNDAEVLLLNECYRQREALGRAAKRTLDALARSSAFFIKEKTGAFLAEREQLFRWSNELQFTFAGGQETVVVDATKAQGAMAVAGIKRSHLWDHAPGLLVGVQADCSAVNWPWTQWLQGIRHTRITLDDLQTIKGLDFQHVILVMGDELFAALRDGFAGSGRRTYEARKLMRIPYTRARDSLTVLVVNEYHPGAPARVSARKASLKAEWRAPYR